MKRVVIVHRWEGHPTEKKYLWLIPKLKERGFEVIIPEMPNPDEPNIDEWISKLKEVILNTEKETYFIGHSIGCQAIMRFVERFDFKVRGAVFLAPWFNLVGIEDEEESQEIAEPWIKTEINFEKVKSNIKKLISIFSDNDYYVPLSDVDLFKQRLDSETIVLKGKGHFTSEDGVTEIPEVLEALLKIAK